MKTYNKSYDHDSFAPRYRIFKANVNIIDSINAEGRTYTVAINKFADLTSAEFQKIFLGTKVVNKMRD